MYIMKKCRLSLLLFCLLPFTALCSGWYGEADVSNVLYNQPGNATLANPSTGDNTYFPSSINPTFAGALNFGYEFRNYNLFLPALRLGLMYEYFTPFEVDGFLVNSSGRENFKYYDQSQAAFLAAQLDLFNASGFAPYISAAAGAAANQFYGYQEEDDNPSNSYLGRLYFPFAWQLGAGVSYTFLPHWTLGLGFTFTNLGAVKSGSGSVPSTGAALAPLSYSPVEASAVMLSIRNTL